VIPFQLLCCNSNFTRIRPPYSLIDSAPPTCSLTPHGFLIVLGQQCVVNRYRGMLTSEGFVVQLVCGTNPLPTSFRVLLSLARFVFLHNDEGRLLETMRISHLGMRQSYARQGSDLPTRFK
jgi:hypothetical protein